MELTRKTEKSGRIIARPWKDAALRMKPISLNIPPPYHAHHLSAIRLHFAQLPLQLLRPSLLLPSNHIQHLFIPPSSSIIHGPQIHPARIALIDAFDFSIQTKQSGDSGRNEGYPVSLSVCGRIGTFESHDLGAGESLVCLGTCGAGQAGRTTEGGVESTALGGGG